MKVYNSYIVTVAIVLLLTAVILIATGQDALDTYYTIFIIEALIITELYAVFNSKARRGLAFTSGLLFAGFLIVIGIQVIKILS